MKDNPKDSRSSNLSGKPRICFPGCSLRQSLFLLIGALMLAANMVALGQELWRVKKAREKSPYLFLGLQFTGLKGVLGDHRFVGFYTDKDLDDRVNAMQFSQAQYALAPVVLDLNNTEHEWIIFNCTSDEAAQLKIADIGAVPVRRGAPGMILARNPSGQSTLRTK